MASRDTLPDNRQNGNQQRIDPGLYVVATPIGNLGDMVPRAVEVLQSVALIAAEDTRHSAPLLRHFGIATKTMACHEHNEAQASEKIMAILQAGASVALISDAGTPLISDPGYGIVKAAHANGYRVIPVPGASAVTAALSVAGLPTDRFQFLGFLPAKQSLRLRRLQSLQEYPHTLVFYEAPHRIATCLADLCTVFGGAREAVLVRELSKQFETVYKAPLDNILDKVVNDSDQQRGEIVLVVQGSEERSKALVEVSEDEVLKILLGELPLKQAVALTAGITGGKKNAIYQRALALDDNDS